MDILDGYIIIRRLVMKDCSIDWTNVSGTATTYEEACIIFDKEKENLLQSMSNYSKSIIKDKDDVFCIQYIKEGLSPTYCYVKMINLY